MKKNNLGLLLSGLGVLAIVIYMILKDKKWYFYLFAIPVSGALYGIGYALGKDEDEKKDKDKRTYGDDKEEREKINKLSNDAKKQLSEIAIKKCTAKGIPPTSFNNVPNPMFQACINLELKDSLKNF